MTNLFRIIPISSMLILISCSSAPSKAPYNYDNMDRSTRKAYEAVNEFLINSINSGTPEDINKYSKIDTIIPNHRDKTLDIALNRAFGGMPFREKNTAEIYRDVKNKLGRRYRNYKVSITTNGYPIESLIPNLYRTSRRSYDRSRMPSAVDRSYPLVRNLSKSSQPSRGLYNRNIALWHSHGWYYEQKLDRWEWQRARVFQTVEDLLPLSFVLPYLTPMLENAGAQVFMPRERDIQTREIIIDNDTPGVKQYYQEYDSNGNRWKTNEASGFAIGTPPYRSGDNPFHMGTSRSIEAAALATGKIRWLPNVTTPGEYGVYIAYAASDTNVTDARYTVYHAGGKTDFLVNQQMSGGTWVYLGKFQFNNSIEMDIERVELTNQSQESGKIVTADAVRFGGGMGNIERDGQISNRPRFVEAARYYLQYAGMPDTLVYNLNEDQSDYKDDYQCRAEWVNYLRGAPFGPNRDRMAEGLKIPIDLSLGFHTDAGFTRNDTVIGTLSIYSSKGAKDSLNFPDGMSRLANRDFSDILQTQVVNDIRSKYDPAWNRRQLWDRGYSEAYRPNVPASLLELLSHHNFLDMKFALDPRFRFDASRSIYKAMLKFIATQYELEYTVQPLPISHFQATLGPQGGIDLNWQAVNDPLEPSASPTQYIVYTRFEGEAFDNGILVDETFARIDSVEKGYIYSFKVTAVNEGGESFPSEILSVCQMARDSKPVLIINGFDRISAAATIETSKYLGFADYWDEGVPDKFDINYIGTQYDFLAESPWLDDDSPGHGSSYGDLETQIIAGNTFDFPLIHGKSIKAAGYSFVSASDEAVMDAKLGLEAYSTIDLILGEEKEVPGPKPFSQREFKAFPKILQEKIKQYTEGGGHLFVSGAHVGSDLFTNSSDSIDIKFGEDVLKYRHRTDHAVKTGEVYPIDSNFFPEIEGFAFNTDFNENIYKVESPDAIEAVGPNSKTILRYTENNTSAGIAHSGQTNIVIFGFPFETILKQSSRDSIMQSVLKFLNSHP